jgi:hypothetical protein
MDYRGVNGTALVLILMGVTVAVLGVSPSPFWGFAIAVGLSFTVAGYGLYQVAGLLRRAEEQISQSEGGTGERKGDADSFE